MNMIQAWIVMLMVAVALPGCGDVHPPSTPSRNGADGAEGHDRSTTSATSSSLDVSPLQARAHLPLPERLIGLRFVSTDDGERGIAPGPLSQGHYILTFHPGGVMWEHADKIEWFDLKQKDQGLLAVAAKRSLPCVVHPERSELSWDGVRYRLLWPDEEPAELKIWPMKIDGKKIVIDLTDGRRRGVRVDVAMGSVSVRVLGIQDGYCVFDFDLEVEMGHAWYRHRLPVSDKVAMIDATGVAAPSLRNVKTSFDMSKARRLGADLGFKSPHMRLRLGSSQQGVIGNYSVSTQYLRTAAGTATSLPGRVRIRCFFYSDGDYTRPLVGVSQGKELAFEASPSRPKDALDFLVTGMTPGSWRRAAFRSAIAGRLSESAGRPLPEHIWIEYELLPLDPASR